MRAVKREEGWFAYSDDGLDKISGPHDTRGEAVREGGRALSIVAGRRKYRSGEGVALPPRIKLGKKPKPRSQGRSAR